MKINTTAFGKLAIAAILIVIFLNSFIKAYTWFEAGVSAAFFLGPAIFLIYWARKERREKANSQAVEPTA